MDKDHKVTNQRDSENDGLDRELTSALAKYAAVEPRAGLEDRVLANLRAEQARIPNRAWWRWSVAAVLVTVIIVAVAVVWRSGKPSQVVVAHHPSNTTPVATDSGTQVVAHGGNGVRPQGTHPVRKTAGHYASHPVVVATGPKLDQFPSPQPLSEQEKILVSYVAEYPEHAVLVARAQAEMLRQDQEDEMRKLETGRDNDLQQSNQ